jgi:hypothetical protein
VNKRWKEMKIHKGIMEKKMGERIDNRMGK